MKARLYILLIFQFQVRLLAWRNREVKSTDKGLADCTTVYKEVSKDFLDNF